MYMLDININESDNISVLLHSSAYLNLREIYYVRY